MDWNAEQAAARGAALLDDKIPGWHLQVREAIVSGKFDMQKWDTCVVGSVEQIRIDFAVDDKDGIYEDVIAFNGTRLVGWSESVRHGFEPPDIPWDEESEGESEEVYVQLQAAWEREVLARNGKEQT